MSGAHRHPISTPDIWRWFKAARTGGRYWPIVDNAVRAEELSAFGRSGHFRG
jgi:hypothetical protein